VQGFISIVVSVGESSQLEVGLVGDEGMLGLPLLLGVDTSPLRALVQGPGSAWRIGAEAFSRELERIPAFRIELLRYLQACYLKLAQAAACTRFHVVEERLARWLLMTQDRAHGEAFHMTHQFLAELLGVRRVGITKAASAMQERGLIEYHRGQIHILDRAGLKRASCSCYQSERDIYDGLLLPARPRVRSRAARPA